jgi:hypothetical protein
MKLRWVSWVGNIVGDGITVQMFTTKDPQAEAEWMRNDYVHAFLRVYLGVNVGATRVDQALSLSERVFLQHVVDILGASNSVQHNTLWKNSTIRPSTQQIFTMLIAITEHIRLTKDVSVDNLVRHLGSKAIFNPDLLDNPDILEVAYRAVFVAVGALTMLYTTTEDGAITTLLGLQIVAGGQYEISVSPNVSQAMRALSEFLRLFGDILPQNDPTTPGLTATRNLILTPNISLATICQVGKLRIQWVLCVGAHLTLDLERQTLFVFALPSFCNLSMTDVSPFGRQVAGTPTFRQYELKFAGYPMRSTRIG